jgi:hypothetical protein
MILGVSQQFAGLAIINTYSTCALHILPCCCLKLDANGVDFFSLAGLTDPFLGTVILR